LGDLRRRLGETRWAEQPVALGWELGADFAYVRELCEHWRGEHDWRATEKRLNSHENLCWEGLHCLRIGADEDRVPVVLLHGWPSGPLEYVDAAERMAEEGYPVIVPSLPGFGWSEDPGEPLNVAAVAEQLHALVADGLGIERYAVAGGDWGATIAARMAFDQPAAVAGLYLSTPGTLPVPGDLGELTQAEQDFVETGTRWRRRQGHHLVIQSLAPDVISPALNDSPAGLAAYLLDKYRKWSDCDGNVEKRFSKDQLCDFVTMFWVQQTIASSMRLYWGERSDRWLLGAGETVGVPAAVSLWAGQIPDPPREWTERILTDLRSWTEIESGGHFAALEEPEAYVSDLREFLAGLD
jgi:pimeloyl-ACP methyl ester carboxylesterase